MKPVCLFVLIFALFLSVSIAAADDFEEGMKAYNSLDFDKGRQLLESALLAGNLDDKQKAEAHYSLGMIYLEKGQQEKSKSQFEQFLRLRPGFRLSGNESPKVRRIFDELEKNMTPAILKVVCPRNRMDIFIDGKLAGRSTTTFRKLSPGIHQVIVEHIRTRRTYTVELESGKTTVLEVDLGRNGNRFEIDFMAGVHSALFSTEEWRFEQGSTTVDGDFKRSEGYGFNGGFQFFARPLLNHRFWSGFRIDYYESYAKLTLDDYRSTLVSDWPSRQPELANVSENPTHDYRAGTLQVMGMIGYDFDYFAVPVYPYWAFGMGPTVEGMIYDDYSESTTSFEATMPIGVKGVFKNNMVLGLEVGISGGGGSIIEYNRQIPDSNVEADQLNFDISYTMPYARLILGYQF